MTKRKLCPSILKTFSNIVIIVLTLGFTSAPCVSDDNSSAVRSEADTLNSIAAPENIEIIPGKDEILYFDKKLGRADLEYLNAFVKHLKENPEFSVRIVGHSDNSGTLADNKQASIKRADLVYNFLVENGIPRGKLYKRGVGSMYPIGTNATEQGRRKNRRVEVISGGK